MSISLRMSPYAYAYRTCKHPCANACAYASVVHVNQAQVYRDNCKQNLYTEIHYHGNFWGACPISDVAVEIRPLRIPSWQLLKRPCLLVLYESEPVFGFLRGNFKSTRAISDWTVGIGNSEYLSSIVNLFHRPQKLTCSFLLKPFSCLFFNLDAEMLRKITTNLSFHARLVL